MDTESPIRVLHTEIHSQAEKQLKQFIRRLVKATGEGR